jgi:hypothetical protein
MPNYIVNWTEGIYKTMYVDADDIQQAIDTAMDSDLSKSGDFVIDDSVYVTNEETGEVVYDQSKGDLL